MRGSSLLLILLTGCSASSVASDQKYRIDAEAMIHPPTNDGGFSPSHAELVPMALHGCGVGEWSDEDFMHVHRIEFEASNEELTCLKEQIPADIDIVKLTGSENADG